MDPRTAGQYVRDRLYRRHHTINRPASLVKKFKKGTK